MHLTKAATQGVVVALMLAAATLALACTHALAQPRLQAGDPANGLRVAERLCAGCHRVAALPSSATTNTDVMSFAAIARRSNGNAEYLAGRIIVPHPAMPDTALKLSELRDVIAYILSLEPTR